jgi:Uma2 family endonuclease
MVSQLQSSTQPGIVYPEDDGKPMSDNTKQFRWIMVVYYNLDWLFADDPSVFVAGNLLWYPVEGKPNICQAPDVMVVFGAAKGDRGSYKQWEENDIAPQVVFEIVSPGNSQTEMNKKLLFYARYGVEEYYIYDPQKNDLSGWLRSSELATGEFPLQVIEEMDRWVSPRLGIRFDKSGEELQIYRPNGEPFATYIEIQRQLEQAQAQVQQAQERAKQAEQQLKEMEDLLRQYRERFGDLPE